jgi:plastocyanin
MITIMVRGSPVLFVSLFLAACSSEPSRATLVEPKPAPSSARAIVSGSAVPGSMVTLEPKTPRDFPIPSDARVIDQFGMQFIPSVVIAQVGQAVEFRSSEDVLHNVRVDEPETRTPVFNVATPPFESYKHVFEKAGYYNVACDVHPAMRASILITTTPFAAVADASGAFAIPDVEPGDYVARIYGTRTSIEQPIAVTAPRTVLAPSAR